MRLTPGYYELALNLQESDAAALSSDDVSSRLSQAIRDKFNGSGDWGWFRTYYGDGESGDVVYSCGSGDCQKAPYTIDGTAGASKCSIDFDKATSVIGRMIYEPVVDDDDHFASIVEALTKTAKLYTEVPLYERFISKKERDAMPSEDFAGKGNSFPIRNQEDVDAAVRSLGRAGSDNYSTATIKANIVKIAKRKGLSLPSAWGDKTDASEAARVEAAPLSLKESAGFPVALTLSEALGPDKKIKIIAPGKGSTAYYTSEALKKAAVDKIFRAGTPMRIDHPTMAQESERPEGSVKDWGAVLSSDAVWMESHRDGPGLYASIKPFSDTADFLTERAPYAGVSIRATGKAVVESGRPVLREGVPLLSEFTSAEGVDMVTQAGAGGMFLSESARPAPSTTGADMDEATVKRLIEAETKPLRERALRGDATVLALRVMESLELPAVAKTTIIERALLSIPRNAEGNVDETAFSALLTSEAAKEAGYINSLMGGRVVVGAGLPGIAPAKPSAEALKEAEARRAAEDEEDVRTLQVFGVTEATAKAVVGKAAL